MSSIDKCVIHNVPLMPHLIKGEVCPACEKAQERMRDGVNAHQVEQDDLQRRAGAQARASIAIKEERLFQDEKFGPDSRHTIGEWILIMEAELEEAKIALIKGGAGRNSVLQEIVQVCAVGMACLEQHGTGEVGRMQSIVKEPVLDAWVGRD